MIVIEKTLNDLELLFSNWIPSDHVDILTFVFLGQLLGFRHDFKLLSTRLYRVDNLADIVLVGLSLSLLVRSRCC